MDTNCGEQSRTRRAVLVVDDHDQVREMLCASMQALGCAVDAVSDGPAALPLLGSHHYDAVICDLVAPGMTGDQLFGLCQRHHPETARRFIFLCGPRGAGPAVAASGQPSLAKPCHLRDLQSAILAVASA